MAKLCLGTVQFGMKYGINNKWGQPTEKEVFEMLDIAMMNGIDSFDTAMAYGEAEVLLGKYIESNNLKNKIKIISKLKPNIFEENNTKIYEIIETEVVKSLKNLNVDILDGYLLHTPTYFYKEQVMENIVKIKEKGMVNHIGVSIYEENHAVDVVKCDMVDYIQIPYSIFDQRIDKTDFFEIAKEKDITVFARSAFLQGLITMEEDKIPIHLQHACSYIRLLNQLAEKYEMSAIQIALQFVLANEGIDYLVFGVDTKEQLKEDIFIAQSKPINYECINEIIKYFVNVEKSIIFPSLWSQK